MEDMSVIAGRECPEELLDKPLYVPRIPIDTEEANAMMKTLTILTDLTRSGQIRDYAGYTEAELMRGKPGVRVGREDTEG
jgi:hypothetical protein